MDDVPLNVVEPEIQDGTVPPWKKTAITQPSVLTRWLRAQAINVTRHAAALRLLQYVRDEAHRFAQHYHHLLRRKKLEE